jgi:flagellar basal-body rod protein FlgC
VHSIEPDFKTPLRLEYNPSSEYADANGFVQMPNVTSQIETADLREAGRAYEANITAIENAKQMMTRSLDLIR